MTIDGTGFVSELPTTVLFRNGLQTFDCKISSITYNQINCHMVKIASSLKFEDSDFAGFIKIGETEFSMRTDPYESQDAYTPKVTQMYPLMISNAGEEFTVKGSVLNRDEFSIQIPPSPESHFFNLNPECVMFFNPD